VLVNSHLKMRCASLTERGTRYYTFEYANQANTYDDIIRQFDRGVNGSFGIFLRLSRKQLTRESTEQCVLDSLSTQIRRGDPEFFAVLDDGAAGDADAAVVEGFGDGLVAEGRERIFAGDQRGHRVLGVGAAAEEDVEADDLLRGKLDVFVQQGAADGGLVHAELLGELGAGERADEGASAGFEEALLMLDQGRGDALDRPLTTLDVLEELVGTLDVFDHVLL